MTLCLKVLLPMCSSHSALGSLYFLYHEKCIRCHSDTLKQKTQIRILFHKLISFLFSLCVIFNIDQIFSATVSNFSLKTATLCVYTRTMALGSTKPPTEMSTRNISWGVKAAGA
jgi:hypothetical protein